MIFVPFDHMIIFVLQRLYKLTEFKNKHSCFGDTLSKCEQFLAVGDISGHAVGRFITYSPDQCPFPQDFGPILGEASLRRKFHCAPEVTSIYGDKKALSEKVPGYEQAMIDQTLNPTSRERFLAGVRPMKNFWGKAYNSKKYMKFVHETIKNFQPVFIDSVKEMKRQFYAHFNLGEKSNLPKGEL